MTTRSQSGTAHRIRRTSTLVAALAVAAVGLGTLPAAGGPATNADGAAADAAAGHHRPEVGATLVPIGGGYETPTLQQYAQLVQRQALRSEVDRTVDIAVIPSSYGDAPEDRQENLELAGERTTQLDAACEAVLDHRRFTGCTATLSILLDRADALDPANSATLRSRGLDGVFVLGGDQVLAMQVLANTPAETALTGAHARGVVISGTSAGNAVESRSMITGYTQDGYPETGLQRAAVTVGWGDDLRSDDRGLAFGSQRFVFDQHFYQRGRFGRLLNVTAQSVQRYGGAGKLGLGVDYATAPIVSDDARIDGVIGLSSAAILDYRTATRPRWVGAELTLSVRTVLTQLIGPGTGITYDAVHRLLKVNGRVVATPTPARAVVPRTAGRATVILGGGENDSASSAVLQRFRSAAGNSRVVVVAAGYPSAADAEGAAASYRSALQALGGRTVTVLVAGRDRIDVAALRGAAVVLLGGDQTLMAPVVADRSLAAALRSAIRSGPAVLTENAATAAVGRSYDAVPAPTDDNHEDEGIAQFRADHAHRKRGWNLVSSSVFEPRLTTDYRWGRLFAAVHSDRATPAVGISEQTALVLEHGRATTVGERSVVTLDGRRGAVGVGTNGAFVARGLFLSTYAAGDALR
ncbi:MAG: Type 1 glutamine amidotransferase-like domain-containing protein [Nakamurella sp.]